MALNHIQKKLNDERIRDIDEECTDERNDHEGLGGRTKLLGDRSHVGDGGGRGSLIGLASFAALLIWVNVGLSVVNPFDPFVASSSATARFFGFGGVAAWLGVPATIAVFAGLYRLLAHGDSAARGAAIALVWVSIGYATLRVALPLAHTSYASETEIIWRDLTAARTAGFAIDYPVAVPQGSAISAKTRFYFAKDFDIVAREAHRPWAAVGYLLYPKGQAPPPDGNDAARRDATRR